MSNPNKKTIKNKSSDSNIKNVSNNKLDIVTEVAKNIAFNNNKLDDEKVNNSKSDNKKNNEIMELNDGSSNVVKIEETIRKKKQTKNEIYKDDQKRFFDMIKTDTLCIGDSGSFSSKYLKKYNEKIIKEILEGMKKYHHNEMYKNISGTDNKTSLALIKKLCDYHGYDVVKKEIKTDDDRWYVYYIVKQHRELEDKK